MYDLETSLKVIYSSRPIPEPSRIRFYSLDYSGFIVFVNRFIDEVVASSLTINPLTMPSRRYIQTWLWSYARSYILTAHYDLYVAANIAPAGFTPAKVSHILRDSVPTVFLDAIREMARPMVTPSAIMLVPDPNSFHMRGMALNPAWYIRNQVRVDFVDAYLLRFGILYYRSLFTALPTYFSGTNMSASLSREGLKPAKYSVFIETLPEAYTIAEDKGITIKEDESISKSPYPKSENIRDWLETYDRDPDLAFLDNNELIYAHDFIYTQKSAIDYKRDFAFRLLRHHRVRTLNDLERGNPNQIVQEFAPDLQFYGRRPFEAPIPFNSGEFVNSVLSMLDGDRKSFPHAYYLNRFSTEFSDDTYRTQFPTLGTSDTVITSDTGSRDNRKNTRVSKTTATKTDQPQRYPEAKSKSKEKSKDG